MRPCVSRAAISMSETRWIFCWRVEFSSWGNVGCDLEAQQACGGGHLEQRCGPCARHAVTAWQDGRACPALHWQVASPPLSVSRRWLRSPRGASRWRKRRCTATAAPWVRSRERSATPASSPCRRLSAVRSGRRPAAGASAPELDEPRLHSRPRGWSLLLGLSSLAALGARCALGKGLPWL